jgi:hypothetical protein
VGTVIRSERAFDRCIRVPIASARLTDLAPFDAGRAMIDLTSNTAHLSTESVRHLFDEPPYELDTLSANNLGDLDTDITNDTTLPSVAGVSHAWQEIGWSQWTARRWGPFVISADEGDRPVSALPRKVRVQAHVTLPAGLASSKIVAVMTRSSGADEIYSGHPLAVHEITGVASGLSLQTFDLDPSAIVDATYPADRAVVCSGSGATTHVVRSFYLWLGFSIWRIVSDTIEVHSVSAYEYR